MDLKKESISMMSVAKRSGLLGLMLIALAAVWAAPASAAFGIKAFDGQVSANAEGDPYTQALGHPYEVVTWIDFNTEGLSSEGEPLPDGNVKDIAVDAPPGLIGNPAVVGHCIEGQLEEGTCPPESQVGFLQVQLPIGGFGTQGTAIYNMVPIHGNAAEFGANVLGNAIVHIVPEVRSSGDYGLRLKSTDTSQALAMSKLKITLWGVPADSSHDPLRLNGEGNIACFNFPGLGMFCPSGFTPSSAPVKPFLSNPGDCSAGPLTTTVRANSWQDPSSYSEASFVSHLPPAYPLEPDEWGAPTGVTGCDAVRFEPDFEARPSDPAASSPTGLTVDLGFGQDGLEDKDGTSAAPLKDAKVTLPAGMTINPAAASGLESCADADLKMASTSAELCPAGSKIGSVEVVSPLLQRYDENGDLETGPGGVPLLDNLEGSVYLRSQASADPASGEMFRLALVVENEERGLRFKLPGQVRADPQTGQLVTSFRNNPQLPVASVHLELTSGPRGALIAPSDCGTKEIVAELTSWSGQSETLTDSFQVTGPCGPDQSRAFKPTFQAGSENPVGGAFSPFNLRLSRDGGERELTGLSLTAPEGLIASLAGKPYCPEASLAGISSVRGLAEETTPSCPAASQVGSVSVGAGAGPLPFYVKTGKAYLAGPYKGAPLSLAITTPAVAGPFDLGTVLTRAAVHVDPRSAAITVDSDPLPTILGGVRLNIRDLRVSIDRPQFMINPTDCSPAAVSGTAIGSAGASAAVSDRFQVADCASLGFKPKLAMQFVGKTTRSSHPRLKATVTMPKAGANIKKAVVLMPKTELLENAHIKTICTRDQWATDSCPKGSIYGKAKAWTPLLDKPLQGNVYLRANGGARQLPDLVADLKGQIDIELVGYIDAVNARLRARFLNVPDAPVSKFMLDMQGGKKGLLVHNTNVCRTKPVASAKFDGQNGKLHDINPVVKTGCGKAKKSGSAKKR